MRLLTTIFVALLPLVAAGQSAGTPQYYDYSGGSNTNSIPLDNSTNKVQWIYGPNAFRDNGTTGNYCPQGTISRIYFKLGSKASDTANYTDFLIRLSQNVGTTTTWSSTNWTTGLDTVFYKSSFKITGAKADTWIAIPLQKDFTYNPNLSLVFEMSVSAGSGNEVRQNRNSSMDQRKWGSQGSSSASGYGEGLINFGLEIKPASANDAGITGLVAPGKFCPGTRNIYVGIKNFGINQIGNLTLNWSLDGVTQTPVIYKDTLDTLDGKGNRADTILLGAYNFSSAAINLKIWTSAPNGQTDTTNANDTISVQLQSSGINPFTFTSHTPLIQGTLFNGLLNNGTPSDPDGACLNDTISYIIAPPVGLTNSDYGSKWTISEFSFKTFHGNSSANKTITYPSASGNGSFMFYPKSADTDSLYELRVTIQNPAGGCDSTYSRYITAYTKPTAAFTVASPSCHGTRLNFTNNSTQAPGIKYRWYFGDGSTSTDTNAQHTYAGASNYTVSLVAYNYGCSDSVSQTITVETSPIGAYIKSGNPFTGLFFSGTQNDPDLVCLNDTLTYVLFPPTAFTNSAYGTTWTIASHSIMSTGGVPSSNYTFTAPSSSTNGVIVFTPDSAEIDSTYILYVTIRKLNSTCSDITLTHYIKVSSLPTADFYYHGQCVGQPTYFYDASVVKPGLVARKYEFGENNAYSTTANPNYTYAKAGEYTVTYTVLASGGCDDVVKKKITISDKPIMGFDLPQTVCAGNPAVYRDTSILNGASIKRYRWTFMEGFSTDTSAQKDATHVFKTAGFHSVKLEIWTDEGCTNALTKSINVTAGPQASFPQPIGCLNQDMTIINTSTGAVSYEWRFSDGKNYYTRDVQRKFDSAGIYRVTLVAISALGCRDSVEKIIQFYPQPMVDFTTSSECVNHYIYLSDATQVPGGGGVVQWDWIIDDSITATTSKVYHVFTSTGPHKVKLKVKTNTGCVDSVTKMVNIDPQPKADFTLPSSACIDVPVSFLNFSAGSNLSYFWSFNDGKSSTDKAPLHIFTKTGDYDVLLIVTDGKGCRDTMIKTLTVGNGPVSGFDWCVEERIVYFEAKEKSFSKYIWEFGDAAGGMASGVTASYTYLATDVEYTVKLTVTDAVGCSGTKSATVGIGQKDNSTITGCKTSIGDIDEGAMRLEIYPNPFSHKTLIEYELLKAQQVRVSVWDATGKEVAVLSNVMEAAGMQQVSLDANEHKLQPGLYMIRIETEGTVAASQVLRLE